jgi:hypothetical protein
MNGKRIAAVAVLAALLALCLVPVAGASTVGEGRLTLDLQPRLLRSLHERGVRLRSVRPALGRGSVINLPVEGGGLEYSGYGRLLMSGGLEFRAMGRRATFSDLRLDTTFGTLTARLNGRAMALAGVYGQSIEWKRFAAELDLRKLKLTQRAAAAINASLGMRGLLRAGQKLGSATAVGRFETVRVVDGTAYLDFDVGFSEKLRALGVETRPLGGSWLSGTSVAIPDVFGEVAPDLSGGRAWSEQGFALTQSESSAELILHDIEFGFEAGVVIAEATPSLAVPSEARTTALARFRLPVTHKSAVTGALTTPNSPATMTAAFAARLNQAFAAPRGLSPPFAAGEPLQIAFNLKSR